MPDVHKVLQPRYFGRFRCTGAECEDTCCDGWGILVDRETYGKYQSSPAPQIVDRALSAFVEINPASCSSQDYARMRLTGTRCVALHEGLCSIQRALGESYLSNMCSTFPRNLNFTGGVVERSLSLSCPEAARLVLTDPEAMVFEDFEEEGLLQGSRFLGPVDGKPQARLPEIQSLVIRFIRERSRPLWQRIGSLGLAVGDLGGLEGDRAVAVLENRLSRFREGSLDEFPESRADTTAIQLEGVLELILARIGVEYTSPRFLECYSEFMQGLRWTGESTMEELAGRYRDAFRCYFQPFMRRHEHLLENYLANYAFRTLFPYGRRLPDQRLTIDTSGEAMRDAFLLLACHYAIIRTVLIGMAALHERSLDVSHAVKLVQSCTKAFQHSSSVAATMLQVLSRQFGDPVRGAIVVIMD
jgi:lysine-N-methylase